MNSIITVVGSINMDLTTYTSRIPSVGETILGTGFKMNPGGKGANQAVAAAKLGATVNMIGKVGEDYFSKPLLNNLEKNSVNTQYIKSESQISTSIASILVDASGNNCIVVSPGANMSLAPGDIQELSSVITSANVVLMQLEIPLETIIKTVEIAHKNHVLSVLNPAPAQKLPEEVLSKLDIIIPNETEIRILTGKPASTVEEIKTAAKDLLDTGVKIVVVTMGERGALLLSKDNSIFEPAFQVNVVDTVAAGDAFIGGFTYAVSLNKSYDEALRWGNAAGALATTRYGSQLSLPDLRSVQELLNQYL